MRVLSTSGHPEPVVGHRYAIALSKRPGDQQWPNHPLLFASARIHSGDEVPALDVIRADLFDACLSNGFFTTHTE